MNPTKRQLEKIFDRRFALLGMTLVVKHGTENLPPEAVDEFMLREAEATEAAASEVGEELTWEDVRRLVLATLKVCTEYLKRKEPT